MGLGWPSLLESGQSLRFLVPPPPLCNPVLGFSPRRLVVSICPMLRPLLPFPLFLAKFLVPIVSVLSWLQSLLFCASPLSPSILVCHVLFGFSDDELHVVPRVFVYLLNVCKFCIWWARNDFRFSRVCPSSVDVMDRVKARLRFHLPLFLRRFSSNRRRRFFVRQWGARGYISSIVDGRLLVHI